MPLDETITPGQAGHISDHEQIAIAVNDDLASWTSFTPTWTSSGTPPTIGDGSLLGAYKLIGKTLYIRVYWAAGSTTTFGTGQYFFDLPGGVAAKGGVQQSLAAKGFDFSTGFSYSLAAYVVGGATKIEMTSNGAGVVGATSPITWAVTDSISITGVIEIA